MKLILLAAVAAILAVPAGSQSRRADGNEPIIVQSPVQPTVSQWAATVGQKLDRILRRPTIYYGDYPEGTVSVRFICGNDGRPAAVALYEGSGSYALDRIAVRAVSRIRTLHPLPAKAASNQAVRANIIFAASETSLVRQQEKLRVKEAMRVARDRDRGEQFVVIEIGPRTAG